MIPCVEFFKIKNEQIKQKLGHRNKEQTDGCQRGRGGGLGEKGEGDTRSNILVMLMVVAGLSVVTLYINVTSLCCIPEINIILNANYNSERKGESKEREE